MRHYYIRIGRFSIGIRYHDRKFRWFYHPLLPCNEKAEFHFFIDGAKLVPQPAEFCGDCPCASGNYPDVAICGIDHHAHLRYERCKCRKQAVLKPTKTTREGECKKCQYFQKYDKPPFGYCVRNDEITDEAYVKLCFEPIPPIAHKRPEPLGTVTTH